MGRVLSTYALSLGGKVKHPAASPTVPSGDRFAFDLGAGLRRPILDGQVLNVLPSRKGAARVGADLTTCVEDVANKLHPIA